MPEYLSTDPNAGLPQYLSTDPMAGLPPQQPDMMAQLGPILARLLPQTGNIQTDIGYGAAQGIGSTMRGIGELTGLVDRDPVADAALGRNGGGSLWMEGGRANEQTLEMMAPGMGAQRLIQAPGKLAGLARTGLDAAGSAAVGAAQGSDPMLAAGATVAGRGVGAALGAAARAIPGRLINSLIKPLEKEFRFGRDPGKAVAQEGITATSQQGLLESINSRLQEVGQTIGQALDSVPQQPSIYLSPMLKPLQEAAEKALRVGDNALAKRLIDFSEAPIFKEADLLTPAQAAEVKRAVGESTQWTGEVFDKPVNQAKASLYRLLNDAISDAVPGVRALQDRYANLLGASKSLERTMNVGQRGNNVTLTDVGMMMTQADPLSGIGAAAARRGLGSTPAMTGAAQVARTGEVADPLLNLLRAIGLAQSAQGPAAPTR